MIVSIKLMLGQFNFNFSDSITVLKNGQSLPLAWSGGLNYSQVSDIDYDFDGDLDLLIFDRSNDQIRLFENSFDGTNRYYKFVPNGLNLFPTDIRYRLTALDYNQDGKNDLFTYGIGGIKVYRNIGNVTDGLQFQLAKSLLYSNNWGTQLNLYVGSADIPAIVDVDLDGDIDVLTYHISGEYLQYHKNVSQETYGHSDSLIFELKNECWGGFREDVNSNSVFLNDQTSPCQGGNVPNPELKPNDTQKAHAGSTVLAIDLDGNGVKDLILGDVAYPSLNKLVNGGTVVNSNSLMISADPNFPANSTPVSMQLFPAAFWVDVDFDSKKDLLVAPNAKNVSENEASLMKYKNTSNNSSPNFVFESRSFLQEDMIEHGTGSIPVFCDIDNDGLQDLFVSNFYAYKPTLSKESRIAFYKNTGTSTNPVFTFVDNDFLNLSQISLGLRIYPTFGDLDGDGKKDLMLGLENGTLCYLKNTSTGVNPTFGTLVNNYTDNSGQVINVGQYASPQLFDLNKDSKLDLVIGKKTGELVYYENVGTSQNAIFELKNSNLGLVDVSNSTSPDGFAAPFLFSVQDTTYLFVGSMDGAIHFYDSIDGNINVGGNFRTRASDFLNLSRNIGGYSSCAITELDQDANLDLLIGQDLGGLFYLENDPNSNLGLYDQGQKEPFNIKLYPNPANEYLIVDSEKPNLHTEIYLFSISGQLVHIQEGNLDLQKLNLTNLDKGMYILRIPRLNYTSRIIKQ
jgi:hypothetical protein